MLPIDFSTDLFPQLHTQRLRLRKLSLNDADVLLRLRSDKNVMRYLDRDPFSHIEEAEAMIQRILTSFEQNEAISWVITLANSDEMIGDISFWRIDKPNHRAEIGYMLSQDYQGKGLMSEALKVIIAYGFKTLHLHSIEANINPLNVNSRQLLLKAGFQKEAYFRENYHYNGQFIDSEIYSLLGSDFKI